MTPLSLLLTSTGGLVSPGQIESLRNNPEGRAVRVVGVDMKKEAIGAYMADAFYQVPSGDDPSYARSILEICRKEDVKAILPTSNEEAIALARARELFSAEHIAILASSSEVLELAFDKARAYQFLRERSLPCAKFFVARSVEEFSRAARELGFPANEVVMKPPLGRGGRGVRILVNRSDEDMLLKEKPGSLYASFDTVVSVLEKSDPFPELLVMEYLPGEYYSVDFLAYKGEVLAQVPKVRVEGTPSQTLVGVVRRNAEVEEAIKKISAAFRFDYMINIEMKFSREAVPLPYDLNPRIAASIAFCSSAGANLLYYGVKMALGEAIPENLQDQVREGTKMVRYFKEFYA